MPRARASSGSGEPGAVLRKGTGPRRRRSSEGDEESDDSEPDPSDRDPFSSPQTAADVEGGGATEKLQKVLARFGFGSRRSCETIIRGGRVQVNGRPARVEDRVNVHTDHITVDRRPLPKRPASVYIMLHKPKATVTSSRDPQGRRTVLDLIDIPQRVFPVGRLDYDSTGMLILTNDGEFAQRLAHPRHHVPRIYMVWVRGDVPPTVLGRLRHGVKLDDGMSAPARVEKEESAFNTTLLRFTLQEGRNRQIRRMCEAVSHPVISLHRIGIGPLRLGNLSEGKWRFLSPDEVARLDAASLQSAQPRHKAPAGRARSPSIH